MEKRISTKNKQFRHVSFSALWQARDLLLHLMKRDLLVTYKQTVLGAAWVALQPLAMAITIIFVFDHIGDFPDYGFPYFLIALAALVCWEFFSGSVNKGCTCLVDDRDLIVRANFPRIVLLVNAALKNTIGPIINLCVLFGFMVYFNIPFSSTLILIPFIFLATAALNFGLGLWLGTLNVFKRDISALTPYLLRLALFISPVAFTLDSVPEQWRLLYCFNPLVGIIESMRFCILGEQFRPEFYCLAAGSFSLFFLLVSGLYIFGLNERKFADVI